MRKAELLFIKYCAENKLEKVRSYLNLAEDLEVDINAVDYFGFTAAHCAASSGHAEVIRILAATGLVDWNKAGLYGYTPLHRALLYAHSDVTGIIVKQDNLNLSLKTRIGTTLAMAAVIGGSVRCVEILAEQENCNIWNIPDRNGDTPLMLASKKEKIDILKLLLDCPRVDPNLKDQDGNSPLMFAIKRKKTAKAMLMIKCPRVNLGEGDGVSLVRIARENDLPEVSDLLVETMASRMGQEEARIEELEEENTKLTIDQVEKIPECPVCLNQFQKDRPVYSCPVGHHICGICKVKIQVCPKCQRPVSGEARAHDFEQLVNDLWG